MKSQIFKNAWLIFRKSKTTFSNALKLAWQAFKLNARVFVSKPVEVICYTARVGNSSFFREKLSDLKNDIQNYRPINSDGAKYDYGCGLYNGD